MSAGSPVLQIDELAELSRAALPAWGLDGAELRLLKHRENAVFGVRSPATAQRWVLRVHRAAYHSDQAIVSELTWMQALGAAGIDVPDPVPATDGSLVKHVGHPPSGVVRQCDVLRWIPGTPIGAIEGGAAVSVEAVETDHYQAGRIAGAVHNQSQRWRAPAGFERPLMDAQGLVGERGYLGNYRMLDTLGPAELELLDRAAGAVCRHLEAFGYGSDRFGLVHGDFLPENLLRDGADLRLIDFDDCGHGWHLMDMATSLFFLLGQPAYDPAYRGFVAGYRSVRPLPSAHLEMLPTFLLARGLSYLGWCATRQETAEAQELGGAVTAAVLGLAADYLED